MTACLHPRGPVNTQEMHPAALPGGPHEDRGDGLFEPQVVVRDHELDPTEPPSPQALEERHPEGLVLGVSHLDAEHLPVAVGGDAGGHHDGPRDHPAPDPALHVGGVGEDVGELHVVEGAVSELLELLVEPRKDPAHLGLGDPRGHPEGLHQLVDPPRRDPLDVGLHDHGEQGPVDAPAALKEAWEEASRPELRDPELHVPGRGGQQAPPVAVSLGGALLGALVAAGADPGRGLGLDELLEDPLQAGSDALGQLAGLDGLEQLGQVKLGEGHRWPPLVCLDLDTTRLATVAHLSGGPLPIYTTSRDVPLLCEA